MEDANLTEACLPALCKLTSLVHLAIPSNLEEVHLEEVSCLTALTGLTELDLKGTQVGDDCLPAIIELKQLRNFSISSSNLTPSAVPVLSGVGTLQNLNLELGAMAGEEGYHDWLDAVAELEEVLPGLNMY